MWTGDMDAHNILSRQDHSRAVTHRDSADAESFDCLSRQIVENTWQPLCPSIEFQVMYSHSVVV